MRMQSFHLSTQGASHIKRNKECQDSSDSYYDDNCAIAIVCDGHGGDDYVRSASGSAFACAAAKTCILNFIGNVNKDDLRRHHKQLIYNLNASIISAWNEAVYDHYEANPFTEAEIAVLSERAKRKYLKEKRIESAYGTTLIAVACTKDYWFGIHIGDGKCVAVNPEGRFLQPIPWDDKCFLNATTSICDSDALNRFRSFYSEKLPVAVFVGSDGIDDCFSTEQQLNNLYKTVLYSFATSEFDTAVEDLRDYLPRLSAKGSGDDVSVSAVLDLDRIGQIDAVKEFDRQKEKARVEENARIAAQKAEEERKRVEAERAEQLRQQQGKRSAIVKRCSNCGNRVLSGMNYCSHCGICGVPSVNGATVPGVKQNPEAKNEEQEKAQFDPQSIVSSDETTVAEKNEQVCSTAENEQIVETVDAATAVADEEMILSSVPDESADAEQTADEDTISEPEQFGDEVVEGEVQDDAESVAQEEVPADNSDV